eukprot:Pgem_evm1s2495
MFSSMVITTMVTLLTLSKANPINVHSESKYYNFLQKEYGFNRPIATKLNIKLSASLVNMEVNEFRDNTKMME